MRSAPRTRTCRHTSRLGQGATIGDRAHSSAWLPPVYNGTSMRADPKTPIFDIKRPDNMSVDQQRRLLDMVGELNREQKKTYPLDQDLESRIANYELAARMQVEALKVADLDQESEATKKLYGIDAKVAGPFGKLCLMARRLVEKDVRFVQVYARRRRQLGHAQQHRRPAPRPVRVHRPGHVRRCSIDLEQRGMLKDTLVVWSGEFGRLPTIEAKNSKPGRDHNPYGFSMWMAGAGLKPGFDYGQTDELGYAAVRDSSRPQRHPRDHPAPAGHRLQQEHVPLRRPRRVAGRRQPRPRHQGDPRMNRRHLLAGSLPQPPPPPHTKSSAAKAPASRSASTPTRSTSR